MGIEAKAISNRLPDQPIQITVQVQEKENKDDGYIPGMKVYWVIEGLMHVGIASRMALECNDNCSPVYLNTYLIAGVAGAAFGIYKALNGKSYESIAIRAKAFGEGEWTTKLWAIAEQTMMMAGPLKLAESKALTSNFNCGSFVAGYWGFNLGAELSALAYKKLVASDE